MKTIKRNSKPAIRTMQQLLIVLESYDMLLSAAWKSETVGTFLLRPTPGNINKTSLRMAKAVADFISNNGGRELLLALAQRYSDVSKVCILNGIIHVVIPCGNHFEAIGRQFLEHPDADALSSDLFIELHIEDLNAAALRC